MCVYLTDFSKIPVRDIALHNVNFIFFIPWNENLISYAGLNLYTSFLKSNIFIRIRFKVRVKKYNISRNAYKISDF